MNSAHCLPNDEIIQKILQSTLLTPEAIARIAQPKTTNVSTNRKNKIKLYNGNVKS